MRKFWLRDDSGKKLFLFSNSITPMACFTPLYSGIFEPAVSSLVLVAVPGLSRSERPARAGVRETPRAASNARDERRRIFIGVKRMMNSRSDLHDSPCL